MRMDEIGWHSIHGSDFMNEREHGAGDWVFLLIKSPCRIFVNGEMRQFPAYTWVLYTPDAYQNYGADGEEYYDDWMHFAPDATGRSAAPHDEYSAQHAGHAAEGHGNIKASARYLL